MKALLQFEFVENFSSFSEISRFECMTTAEAGI